jgi:hypothetical protein
LYRYILDGVKRLLKPAVEREVRATLRDEGLKRAVTDFGANLRALLLAPPMRPAAVVGLALFTTLSCSQNTSNLGSFKFPLCAFFFLFCSEQFVATLWNVELNNEGLEVFKISDRLPGYTMLF